MKSFYYLLAFFLFVSVSAQAQIFFYDQTNLLPEGDFHSGVAIAVADMNADGLDDIIRLSQARNLQVEMQTPNGTFETVNFGMVSDERQWSICIADVDNDGYNDILSGGRYDGVKVYYSSEMGETYTMDVLPGPNMFIQASNFADINNDGMIDVFACHDDDESRIWANDGTGSFTMADEWIDMATDPVSDNSGNYGSVWTDFDNDGDLDLYIAKCRQGVNNVNDPRRINALFVNDGDNNYTEMADSFGLKIGWQSWTSDFQDIDNDGDLDCFITNHDAPSQLLENDGSGHFTDITDDSGISISGTPIQGVFRDFDNDGFVDLLVSGSQQFLYRNNGDKTFTLVDGLFNNFQMESYALGDLNHDGFVDIYAGYAGLFNSPSNINDALWLNMGNENNFLAVNLIGQESNRNGIGARIEIYGSWGKQIREVRAGESYGISNTHTQHFGLGESEMVDSLIIRWPSGIVDIHENVNANQFISVIENSCISPDASLDIDGETVFCSGSSVTLTAPEGFSYAWSNGDSSQAITIAESGNYNVTISDDGDCFGISNFVEVTVDPEEIPALYTAGDTIFCQGGSVELSTDEATSYLWSNGETTQSIMATEAGTYTVAVPGLCETFTSEAINISLLIATVPEVEGDTITEPGVATLSAVGDSIRWYDAPSGGDPIGSGNLFETPFIAETTTYYAEQVEVFGGQVNFTGLPAHSGPSFFNGNFTNGQLIFDCHSPFTLKSVKVGTDTEGIREIEIRDLDNNVLANRIVFIPEGESTVELNLDVEPGTNLILTTNSQTNNEELGFNSPRLWRTENASGYPFTIDGIVSINESNFGTSWYYYFYDWEVKEPEDYCASERVAAEATVNLVNSTAEIINAESLRVYPNPTSGQFTLENKDPENRMESIEIMDLRGKTLYNSTLNDQNIETLHSELPKGIYLLKVNTLKGLVHKRLIIQ